MERHRGGFLYGALVLFGAIMVLLGLAIGGGGAYLALLGGSVYYLIAGLGLILSGVLLCRGRMAGASLYTLVFAGTVIWAFWEVGLDGWALVPRLAGPAVLMVIVLAFTPVLQRASRPSRENRL